MTDAQRALSTAGLRSLGVGRGELDGPRWRRAFRGVHTPAVPDASDSLQRIYDAAELLVPGGAVGGWAAALLLGVPELDGRGGSGVELEPVLLLAPNVQHRSPKPGVRVLRSRLDSSDVVEVDGIPVTAATRTAFDLARAGSVESGLVAVDPVARRLGLTVACLRAYANHHRRFRGVPVARDVFGLVDPRSRSAGETRLRYVWVIEAALPTPQSNPLLIDRFGSVVAMPDLLDPSSGLAAEYDGATHRELSAHTADNAREEDVEALGVVVVRATSIDVGPRRAQLVIRLQQARQRALQVPAPQWGWRPSRLPPSFPTTTCP